MSAICLFGALCSINQDFLSNGLASFDQGINKNYSKRENYENSNQSPCPSVFRYIQSSGKWYGKVTLENYESQGDIKMRVEMTIGRILTGTNAGELDLTNSRGSDNNQPLIYLLKFPTQNPIPKIKGIYYNEQRICSGPGDTGNAVATINLSTTLQTSNRPTVVRQNNQAQTAAKKPANINPPVSNEITCGTTIRRSSQSLVIGGKEVSRGEWPWLVAFYGVQKLSTLQFICGGNLISKSHVITAAHCIQDKGKTRKLRSTEAVVYIGRHNLNDFNEPGFEERGIERFITHSNWKPFDSEYDADIAIIVMDAPVEYSEYIRPICVWQFSNDINDVIGQRGILAGWGLNEKQVVNTEYPKTIDVKIINDGACFRPFPALLSVSSERTFCASGDNDESPCSGDSGGGLLLKRGDKWYLRGLVSASLSSEKGECVTDAPVIFTDVARFKNWIRSNTQ